MTKLLLLLQIALFFFASALAEEDCKIGPPYNGLSVSRLTFQNQELKTQVLEELETICEIKYVQDRFTDPNADFIDLILTPEQIKHAQSLMDDSDVRILLGNLGSEIAYEKTQIESEPESADSQTCSDDGTCGATTLVAGELDVQFYKKYHTYDQLVNRWEKLTATYSDYVQLEVIGKTLEGRPIHMFRIGQTDEEKPQRILLNAMQHAREWITPMSVLHTIETLCIANYKSRSSLGNIQLLVVPISNPDGFVYTHTNDRMWRKNRNPRNSCRGSPSGVDLNRNWGTDFAGGESTSSNPCSDVFTGPEPFSELETQALKKVIESTPGLKAHIDVHSFSQLVLGRWSYSDKLPEDVDEVNRLGNILNDKLSSNGRAYTYARGKTEHIYLASGVMPDWVYDAHGIMSFTYEMRPKSMWEGGFMLPASQILDTATEFFASIQALIEWVENK